MYGMGVRAKLKTIQFECILLAKEQNLQFVKCKFCINLHPPKNLLLDIIFMK